MRAVIYDPQARENLRLADVDEPAAAVLDNVGGRLLAEAFGLVGDGGSAQSIGMASNEPTTIDFEAEGLSGVQKSLEPFNVRTPFARDLGYRRDRSADRVADVVE